MIASLLVSPAPLRVLGISGSLRPGSCSRRSLEHLLEVLERSGCRTHLFDPRETPLPFCNGDKKYPWPECPEVGLLRRQVMEADAVVFATPEYHGGMSGVLKNLIDLLDFEHLEGKVVAGVSVLGGMTNSNALNDLRQVMRWCHAWMIPEQVAIGHAKTVFAAGAIRDPELLARFESLAASLTRHARLLSPRFTAPVEEVRMELAGFAGL